MKWDPKAADQGVAEAQYNLGPCNDRGEGVQKDYGEALNRLRESAMKGLVEAQYQLAIMFANGEGVAAHFDEAVSWLRKSAAQGHANRSSCYSDSEYLSRNDPERR